MQTKQCFRCGETKSITKYYFRKNRNAYMGVCKKCKIKECVKSHRRNPEVYRRINKEWADRNPEKIKSYRENYHYQYRHYQHRYKYRHRCGIEIKNLVFARDNNQCQICLSSEDLTIHHLDGNGRHNEENGLPVNNEPNNLQVLCRSCHGRLHRLQTI